MGTNGTDPTDLITGPIVSPEVARIRERNQRVQSGNGHGRTAVVETDIAEQQKTPKRDTTTPRPARATARTRTLPPVVLPDQHTYGQLPRWLDKSGRWKAMTGMEAKVYGLMAMRADTHTGTCCVSERDLAKALGVSTWHLDRIGQALDGLQNLGAIEDTKRRKRLKTVWRLVRGGKPAGRKRQRTRSG
jgi:hypothetical protein